MLKVDFNLIFTVLNLLVLFVGLRIFLFKPVHRILDERQKQIDQTIAEADAAKEKALALERERTAAMAGIEQEKQQVLADAQKQAAASSVRMLDDARAKAKGMLVRADEDAKQLREELLQKAQTEIAGMVVEATAKIVGAKGAANDSDLYDQFLQKVGDSDDTGNH